MLAERRAVSDAIHYWGIVTAARRCGRSIGGLSSKEQWRTIGKRSLPGMLRNLALGTRNAVEQEHDLPPLYVLGLHVPERRAADGRLWLCADDEGRIPAFA